MPDTDIVLPKDMSTVFIRAEVLHKLPGVASARRFFPCVLVEKVTDYNPLFPDFAVGDYIFTAEIPIENDGQEFKIRWPFTHEEVDLAYMLEQERVKEMIQSGEGKKFNYDRVFLNDYPRTMAQAWDVVAQERASRDTYRSGISNRGIAVFRHELFRLIGQPAREIDSAQIADYLRRNLTPRQAAAMMRRDYPLAAGDVLEEDTTLTLAEADSLPVHRAINLVQMGVFTRRELRLVVDGGNISDVFAGVMTAFISHWGPNRFNIALLVDVIWRMSGQRAPYRRVVPRMVSEFIDITTVGDTEHRYQEIRREEPCEVYVLEFYPDAHEDYERAYNDAVLRTYPISAYQHIPCPLHAQRNRTCSIEQ